MSTTQHSHRPAGAPREGVPAPLSSTLEERIAAKLDEAERALPPADTHEANRLRHAFEELRGLIAQQAATQGHRVEAQVAERTRELSSLSNFLQMHGEREKALLARELHDSLGGILTPAKMDLAWLDARLGSNPEYAERLRRLSALIDQGIDLKRRIIEALRPSLLDHLGLAAALHWFVDEAARTNGIECRLQVSETLERLSPDLEIALYRLVQESVGNIVKHSQAKSMELTLEREARGLRLEIADDGVGIDDLESAKQLSHGLAGMMHRVRSIGGSFDVRSEKGRGTRIKVWVPL
ncbi:MAG TPA: sensor histidine kinase [Usitatibacter sp.]|nr:sensor histidine kinase [Usitatibacter sp.]